MSKELGLVNKALVLLNDVPYGKEANEIVLVLRELKAVLNDADDETLHIAIANDAPKISAPVRKRGRQAGVKYPKKGVKKSVEEVSVPPSVPEATPKETLADKAKKVAKA